MGMTFAVAGKGGTGKTTVAAMLVRWLVENEYRPVMAVDADPNSTLADALGVGEVEGYVADIREKTTGSDGERPAGMSKDRTIEYMLAQCVCERDGFDLLVMGRPEGPGCYCFVNTVLRRYLDLLTKDYPFIVLDNEAGMEHISRRTTNDIGRLLLISEPTTVGIKTAGRIFEMARKLPVVISDYALILNKVPGAGIPETVQRQIEDVGAEYIGAIPLDTAVSSLAGAGGSIMDLPGDNPAYMAASVLFEKIKND